MLPQQRPSRTALRSRLDHAAVTLLRLVADRRSWNIEAAARDLRAHVDDDAALHLLRARISLAMLERPTPTDQRALATLDRAFRPTWSALQLAAAGPRGVN